MRTRLRLPLRWRSQEDFSPIRLPQPRPYGVRILGSSIANIPAFIVKLSEAVLRTWARGYRSRIQSHSTSSPHRSSHVWLQQHLHTGKLSWIAADCDMMRLSKHEPDTLDIIDVPPEVFTKELLNEWIEVALDAKCGRNPRQRHQNIGYTG